MHTVHIIQYQSIDGQNNYTWQIQVWMSWSSENNVQTSTTSLIIIEYFCPLLIGSGVQRIVVFSLIYKISSIYGLEMGIPKNFHLYWRICYYSLYSFPIEKNKRNGKQKHSISNRLVTISSLTNCFSWTNPFCQGVHCANPISGSHQRCECQQIWSWLDSAGTWLQRTLDVCHVLPLLFRSLPAPVQRWNQSNSVQLCASCSGTSRCQISHISNENKTGHFAQKYWNTVSIFLSAVDSGVYKYLIRFEKMVNCRLKSTFLKFMEQQMFTLQKTVLKESWGPTDC